MRFNKNFNDGEFNFFQCPKELFSETYKKLSNDAKLLYMLMYDTNKLSVQNGWINDNGDYYIYYTLDKIQENLNIGTTKAVKLKKELAELGLIEEERQGLSKANKIYVNLLTFKKRNSRLSENESQDLHKTKSNNNNINNNNNNIYIVKNDENDKEDIQEIIKRIRKEYKGTKCKKIAITKLPKLIKQYGEQQLIRAINRYNNKVMQTRKTGFDLKFKNESTWWNGGYMDYLDEEFEDNNKATTPPAKGSQNEEYEQKKPSWQDWE